MSIFFKLYFTNVILLVVFIVLAAVVDAVVDATKDKEKYYLIERIALWGLFISLVVFALSSAVLTLSYTWNS